MTIGWFVVLMGTVTAIFELVYFTRMRKAGRLSQSVYPALMLAALVLPVALYAIFFVVVPDLGGQLLL